MVAQTVASNEVNATFGPPFSCKTCAGSKAVAQRLKSLEGSCALIAY